MSRRASSTLSPRRRASRSSQAHQRAPRSLGAGMASWVVVASAIGKRKPGRSRVNVLQKGERATRLTTRDGCPSLPQDRRLNRHACCCRSRCPAGQCQAPLVVRVSCATYRLAKPGFDGLEFSAGPDVFPRPAGAPSSRSVVGLPALRMPQGAPSGQQKTRSACGLAGSVRTNSRVPKNYKSGFQIPQGFRNHSTSPAS